MISLNNQHSHLLCGGGKNFFENFLKMMPHFDAILCLYICYGGLCSGLS